MFCPSIITPLYTWIHNMLKQINVRSLRVDMHVVNNLFFGFLEYQQQFDQVCIFSEGGVAECDFTPRLA